MNGHEGPSKSQGTCSCAARSMKNGFRRMAAKSREESGFSIQILLGLYNMNGAADAGRGTAVTSDALVDDKDVAAQGS